ncbi:Type-2 restriction enzyme AgeI [Sporomusa termitida]|uniref:Type-2 restriction enzyme AgeI n=2 Tax=Sporomusa termitida TaxID=2377 RepID=A0A517DVG7_9FIRM|nr:Type-2 restriction enzyme AgeI [Sporomusa termitida]
MILQVSKKDTVELVNMSEQDYQAIRNYFIQKLNDSPKKREAIADTLIYAIQRCPSENISDLWHHVIYRTYISVDNGGNQFQSWVRASGDALEMFIAQAYNPALSEMGIRLVPLLKNKAQAMDRMGLSVVVSKSKLDVLIEKQGERKGLLNGYGILGGLHVKASLAERISDDVPASRIMMQAGYTSILWTLDVKSNPPRDFTNRGEFGVPEKPTHKRDLIEERGDFNVCFSYNSRTVPSPKTTKSGRRIHTVNMLESPDAFIQYCAEL